MIDFEDFIFTEGTSIWVPVDMFVSKEKGAERYTMLIRVRNPPLYLKSTPIPGNCRYNF